MTIDEDERRETRDENKLVTENTRIVVYTAVVMLSCFLFSFLFIPLREANVYKKAAARNRDNDCQSQSQRDEFHQGKIHFKKH